jgi:hypothetical protein
MLSNLKFFESYYLSVDIEFLIMIIIIVWWRYLKSDLIILT